MPLGVPSAARHSPNGQHIPTLTLFEISMQTSRPQETFEQQAGAIRNRVYGEEGLLSKLSRILLDKYPRSGIIMTRAPVPVEKPLYWIGSSLKDITRFPSDVQRSVGFALGAAQYGGKHPAAKPWKGEGPGILEVVKDYDGDTYRAIYTVRFAQAVYVLHVFQKKSPRGIETRQSDVALVRERLKVAQRDYEERHG
jgi:phage-related protein